MTQIRVTHPTLVAQEGAKDYWACNGDGNIVLFDTTHRTNRYCAKLGCFTTVGNDGETIILAVLITMQERQQDFEWGFKEFMKAFRVAPGVICTDGDPAIAAAVRAVFPSSTKHQLCLFHLSLNFKDHIKKCFPSQSDYVPVLDAFWRIAKETDERKRETFDDDFDQLVAWVASSGGAEDNVAKATEWLETLRKKNYQWAARFTWATCTRGVHSTQVRCAYILQSCAAATAGVLLCAADVRCCLTRGPAPFGLAARCLMCARSVPRPSTPPSRGSSGPG
jgi:hypothetical protein